MRDYELIFIVNPEVDDEEVVTVVDKVGNFVSEKGGSVVEVNQWGRKKLAYPIERFEEGNYIFVRLKLEPMVTKELEENLRLSEKVLRHLLIKAGE